MLTTEHVFAILVITVSVTIFAITEASAYDGIFIDFETFPDGINLIKGGKLIGAEPSALIDDPQFCGVIGGELLPIDTTALLLAGTQTFSWMIPVVLSVLGIGLFVVSRKS